MKITIIGAGYVGLTTSVALAYLGHQVHCIERNIDTLKALQSGRSPIHEPGIDYLLGIGLPLSFGGWDSFDSKSDLFFIAVGTPSTDSGEVDLSQVEGAAVEIGRRTSDAADLFVVIKSTVPPGTTKHIRHLIQNELDKHSAVSGLTVVFNPEFLREGASLFDTLFPDRIIVGAEEPCNADILFRLYRPILVQAFTIPEFLSLPQNKKRPLFVRTTPTSAELIKYAANAFLAMKISFINEFAGLSEHVGADINEIAMGIGLDERIGQKYLLAGVGWGGSCFGKDIRALLHSASRYNYEMYLVEATVKDNQRQQDLIVQKLVKQLKVMQGANISIFGISFKPDTDDFRDAPFLHIAQKLLDLGASVRAYDPVAIPGCSAKGPSLKVAYCSTPFLAAENSDALLILTEWEEFRHLDYKALGQKMRKKIVLDGRNTLDAEALKSHGFTYIGVGREC